MSTNKNLGTNTSKPKRNKKNMKNQQRLQVTQNINPIKNEIIGLCIIAFSVLLGVFMVSDKTGNVGVIIKRFFLSLLGVGAYLMPFLIFTYGVVVIRNKTQYVNKKRILWFIMVIISFVTIDHLFYQYFSEISWEYNLSEIYRESLNGNGGGIIGGIIAISFYKMFYIYGAMIISITLFTIFTMLAADVSILKGIGHVIKYFRKRKQEKQMEQNLIVSNTQIENIEPKKRDPIINLGLNKKNNVPIINLNEKNINPDNVKLGNNNIDNENNEKKMEDNHLDNIKIISNEKLDEKINVMTSMQRKELPVNENQKNRKDTVKKNKDSKEYMDINYNESKGNTQYSIPTLDFLNITEKQNNEAENERIISNAKKLENTLQSFGVNAKILQVSKGPTVTRYELQPSQGVKVSKIVNLADDIALSLAAPAVRIEAPIPGKAAVGIEIPNKEMKGVLLREVLQTKEFKNSKSTISFAVGMDIEGKPVVADIGKMPHLLIAGSTGSGKSVCINTLIASILYKATPDDVKIIMVDPKVVELNVYNGIPHLMIPVVTDPKKAAAALNWAVQEMLNRYNLFAQTGTRDMKGYNAFLKEKLDKGEEFDGPKCLLPHIVIIIDELADLMMAAPNEVEDAICRLAQMARAAGMHLIIATQRPSVDVLTGVIKANIPSRIAFAVSSQIDSRTILDMAGAEKLLGKGDMLFYPIGSSKPMRVQGPFISDKEVESLVQYIKSQNVVKYDDDIIEEITSISCGKSSPDGDADEMLPQAIEIVMETEQASISMLQRRLRVGFSRAARLIDQMEARGIVGPPEGSKPRKVLMNKNEYKLLNDE